MAILIAYYSRAGENYFGGSYRRIPVGNTRRVAEQLASLTGGDLLLLRLNHTLPFSNRRSITPSPGAAGGSSGRGKHHRPARCAGGSPSLKISPDQTALKIRRCVLLQNTANKQIKSTEMVDI